VVTQSLDVVHGCPDDKVAVQPEEYLLGIHTALAVIPKLWCGVAQWGGTVIGRGAGVPG
jgi:hypothetical protein